ncbi:hypothetical protein [Bdellovibrio sp. HCB274]|uniref:hypothetical protein n=1 Tax=Bdellovibrio sp. HCB274 TaxID=3394361 RepID=UPI0039B50E01
MWDRFYEIIDWWNNGDKWEEDRKDKERKDEDLNANYPNQTPNTPVLPPPFDPDNGGEEVGGMCKYRHSRVYPWLRDLE